MPFPLTHPALAEALAAQGYEEPTPVQAAVLEEGAGDVDLLVSAQTGSGKTVAFGLAMASSLFAGDGPLTPAGAPSALIIAPTRELALQVNRELSWLYAKAEARVVSCVGGMDARREQRLLAAGCHIVVGTPGRLRDHLERGHLDLSDLSVIVLDEADEMLDLGFREDLEFILDAAPEERRTLLFSATIDKEIAALARRFQRAAHRIDTTRRNEPHGDIDYQVIRVAPNEIEHAVVNVLRYFEAPGALVFCSTREAVRHLHSNLRERGFAVVGLSGELSQRERADALQSLRDGRARVCVATDVAARGLDLPDLGLVIHADLPQNKATLLHRSGRTGRAGRKGSSVLIAPYTRRRKAEQLLAAAHIQAAWNDPPSAESIRAKDHDRMLQDATLTDPLGEDELAQGRRLLESRSAEEIAGVLVRLYRAKLPAPEELFREDRPRDGGARAADPDAPRPARMGADEVVWFRLNVGRRNNADPKWLLPMICRLGHVTKKEIGQIRIFDRETKFGVAREVEAKFTAAAKASAEDDIRLEPTAPPDADGMFERPAKPFKAAPRKPAGRPNDRPDARPPFRGKPPKANRERR
ncbi:MAG: DEAD/DEAH box helicase [Caulobacteraceae bacterium]|nr:DEAD/DEAH box helicase [Caulobacteraceae bacterium]